MNLELDGKNVLIVGGENGIGAAAAKRFVAEGSNVCIVDKNVSSSNDNIVRIRCDISDRSQTEALPDAIKTILPTVDCLVHTAAIGSGSFGFPFTNIPIEKWQKVFEVNVLGMANIAYAIAPIMIAQQSGSMVFLSSVAGQIGSQTDPPYSASKAANLNFAVCLARDLAGSNVRVNSVCPGMVQTQLNQNVWQAWLASVPMAQHLSYDVWAKQKIDKLVPLGRWQTEDDIADTILFLSSNRASQITGQTINVDGGYVMR